MTMTDEREAVGADSETHFEQSLRGLEERLMGARDTSDDIAEISRRSPEVWGIEMMETCKRHRRWTFIRNADGTEARRRCPECPRPEPRRFLHMPSGCVLNPAIVFDDQGSHFNNI